jgi:hypothetical protein
MKLARIMATVAVAGGLAAGAGVASVGVANADPGLGGRRRGRTTDVIGTVTTGAVTTGVATTGAVLAGVAIPYLVAGTAVGNHGAAYVFSASAPSRIALSHNGIQRHRSRGWQ